MPLPKRSIEPVHVARSVYQQEGIVSVELETVTNTTLTNIIRQLSSLSKHAEDVFGELARDVGNIGDRANSLQARIDRLAIKVTQLDSTGEEVPLTDITRKKAFKSAKAFDQQIFSRATMPAPMLETYAQCDKPPPLDKLNVYRDDGKDGLKFYTDPNYFFELWRQEMLKDTERVMHDKVKKTHRPRQDGAGSGAGGGGGGGSGGGAGRGHKKRVRTPNNTREKQRQLAIGHGETLMPNNVIYRTPNSVLTEDPGYGSMGIYERPARPNSIELRRSYGQTEQIDGGGNGVYGTMSPQQAAAAQYASAQYATTNGMQQHLHQQQQQAALQQQMYDEAMYHHQQQQQQQQQQHQQSIYGNNSMMSPDGIYAPGTPTRNKLRPSQPPPAPPASNGSSGNGTPNASNANTPTRGRSMSTSRDALPPPPPIPDGMINTTSPSQMLAAMNGGSNHIAAKLLARTNSTTRASGSPQIAPSNSVQDANAMVMAQLNNTINNFNNMNINDLPPPPPVPDQHSPKLSPPPNAAPPPPPPPPPLDDNGMMSAAQLHHQQMLIKQPMMTNGEMQMQQQHQQQANGMIMPAGVIGAGQQQQQQQQQQLIVGPKKMMPPLHDTRTDLMKAIRDGITLRKVEKIEQKEIERNTGLHDVASILARRVAIELSESEESDSDEDDSEDWVEPNETSA